MKSRSKDHLSDADAVYKEELDKLVEELEASRLDDTVAQPLLLQLVEHATKDAGNITTVPKALQFLIEHKGKLCDVYTSYVRTLGDDSYSVFLILELMSFLDAIATPADASKEGQPEKDELAQFKLMLYKIEAGMVAERLIADARTTEEVRSKLVNRKINDWGNEFLTSFSTQIVRFFNMQATRDVYDSMARSPYQMDVAAEVKASVLQRFDTVVVISEALKFTEAITDYFFQHGFEFEAIDLLLEVDLIESIRGKCGNDYDLITRVTSYLISISAYAATHAETRRMLVVAYEILLEAERFAEALRLALKLDEPERLKEVIFSCGNANVRKQLAFSCAAHGTHLSYTEEDLAPGCKLGAEDLEELNMLSSGEHFSGLFLTLAVELDVVDPKMPKDIFKAYPFTKLSTNFSLNDGRTSKGVALDSALGNLSHTFVNAFLNCGFGTDLLINVSESDWVYHHNDYGLLCAVASVGIISLWNVEEGLSRVDKYEYSSNSYVKAGVYAAYGLSSCGVLSEADPLAGLLQYKLDSDDKLESLGAVLGLGFGYAGTQRESLLEYLVPLRHGGGGAGTHLRRVGEAGGVGGHHPAAAGHARERPGHAGQGAVRLRAGHAADRPDGGGGRGGGGAGGGGGHARAPRGGDGGRLRLRGLRGRDPHPALLEVLRLFGQLPQAGGGEAGGGGRHGGGRPAQAEESARRRAAAGQEQVAVADAKVRAQGQAVLEGGLQGRGGGAGVQEVPGERVVHRHSGHRADGARRPGRLRHAAAAAGAPAAVRESVRAARGAAGVGAGLRVEPDAAGGGHSVEADARRGLLRDAARHIRARPGGGRDEQRAHCAAAAEPGQEPHAGHDGDFRDPHRGGASAHGQGHDHDIAAALGGFPAQEGVLGGAAAGGDSRSRHQEHLRGGDAVHAAVYGARHSAALADYAHAGHRARADSVPRRQHGGDDGHRRQAAPHLRLPDAPDPGAGRLGRARGAGVGGVRSVHDGVGGHRHRRKERRGDDGLTRMAQNRA
ncbi:proteasome 26S regulatory subunit, putative [Babesia caballi]|uniref:Proteasome 26S regulatory subunit, putative n=1 Tax=Babesia caballi TaxID=5871 RepID=A0AAV4LSP8_BABCB|nr:proteasome 26S regulatory subunit, putative [Babesia caballi]